MSFLLMLAMAAEIKEISVAVVDDIQNENTLIRTASSKNYSTVYSFTLEKPAIVKVSTAQSRYLYYADSAVNPAPIILYLRLKKIKILDKGTYAGKAQGKILPCKYNLHNRYGSEGLNRICFL